MLKPIVLFLGIAVILSVGAGYLGNNIDLSMAQSLGVGETNLDRSIDSINVDALLVHEEGINESNLPDAKDRIIECKFENADPETIEADSLIFCKLVDENGSVIAEGNKTLGSPLNTNDMVTIPISDLEFLNANDLANIFDIIIVIQGP